MKHTIMTLHASCGGSFSDTLVVEHDDEAEEITASVTCGVPIGGMDGDPTPRFTVTEHRTFSDSADAKLLFKDIKSIINDDHSHTFKRYGKPTKNAVWRTNAGEVRGMSLALCQLALQHLGLGGEKKKP